MRIAVIGVGNVGGGFAKAAVAAGHEVVLSAAHAEKAEAAAAETGARAAASNVDAVEHARVVVLAVPGTDAPTVVAELAPALQDAVVVDATDPLNASFSGLEITGVSGAEDVQGAAGDVPVVKAFNTVFASRYAAPAEDGEPLQVLMAGDNTDAKARVAEVATSLGFAPMDAGGVRLARSLEEMAFLNITLNATNGWAWQSAWQLIGPTA
jgi:8-hydroxy-5-deazaflavin:NADPH oxidoreductase